MYTNTSGAQVIESWTYSYDDVGNRLTMTENTAENTGNVATYTYDSIYRLKSESYSSVGPTVNYTYDGVGNRFTEKRNGVRINYTYDADDRMTARGSTTYGWDDNGNMANETTGGTTTTYEYDYENRLTEVSVAGNSAVEYTYGVQNNRMSREAGGVTTYYMYDFYDRQRLDDMVVEYNATGTLQVRYVHGPDADETLARVGTSTRYYNAEAQGSTTSLTNSTQTITTSYRYEAFGALRSQAGSDTNDQLFTGHVRDSATSLYYSRTRWYQATIGRFTNDEPWRRTPEPSPYVYVLNNPATLVDPDGLSAKGHIPRPSGNVIPSPCWPVPCIDGNGAGTGIDSFELSNAYWEGTGCGIPFPFPALMVQCAGCTFQHAFDWRSKWNLDT